MFDRTEAADSSFSRICVVVLFPFLRMRIFEGAWPKFATLAVFKG